MAGQYLKNMDLMKYAKWLYFAPWLLRKCFSRKSGFAHNGRMYQYFSHPYNATWLNERAIEIPLIAECLASIEPSSVLEIGNVMSHYYRISHTVIDKYEKSSSVVSVDIMDYIPEKKFDLIVSISTIEHVGWDEIPRDSQKHINAINRILTWLAPGGKLYITVPLGYNPSIDADIFGGNLGCDKIYFFKRLDKTQWTSANAVDVLGSTYGSDYRSTNGLAICFWSGT